MGLCTSLKYFEGRPATALAEHAHSWGQQIGVTHSSLSPCLLCSCGACTAGAKRIPGNAQQPTALDRGSQAILKLWRLPEVPACLFRDLSTVTEHRAPVCKRSLDRTEYLPALPPFFPKLKKAWHLQPLLRAPLSAWPHAKLPLLLQQIGLPGEPGWWDDSLVALALMKRLVLAAQGCFRKLATVSGCVGVGPRQQTMNGGWPALSIMDCRDTERAGTCTATACAAVRQEFSTSSSGCAHLKQTACALSRQIGDPTSSLPLAHNRSRSRQGIG